MQAAFVSNGAAQCSTGYNKIVDAMLEIARAQTPSV